jgi:iron complex outermembrane receptor protein
VRKQYSAFGEVYVPLVGDDNRMPLFEELIVNAAVRYDHYNDFGATTNPKVGVTWKPHRDLTFRGSWGTSFRAPGLPDTDPAAFSATTQVTAFPNRSGDPRIVNDFTAGGTAFTNALIRVGGNPDVSAETGTHWSAGVDFQPSFAPGLKLSATYFNLKYEDRIGGPPITNYLLFGGAANAYLAAFATPVTPPAACVNSNPATWASEVRNALSGDVYGPNTIGFLYNASSIVNPCGIRVILDGRTTNLALTRQDGVDLTATYSFNTDAGVFSAGATFTKIFNNRSRPFKGGAASNELDRVGFPISERGRANLTWSRGPASATLFVNYVGSFLNDQPILRYTASGQARDPSRRVPSWTTFDLNLAYALGEEAPPGLRDVRVGVNVTNLFDRDPPIVLSGTAAALGSVHSVYGRTWTVQLTKSF